MAQWVKNPPAMPETQVWSPGREDLLEKEMVTHLPREWLCTLVFLPEQFHGRRTLTGYSPKGCKEWDTTEQLRTQVLLKVYNKGPSAYQSEKVSRAVVSLRPHGLCESMDCSPPDSSVWDSPGKNTRMCSHFLLQRFSPHLRTILESPSLLADSLSSELPGKPWHLAGTP